MEMTIMKINKIKCIVFGGMVLTPVFLFLQLAFSVGSVSDGVKVIITGLGLAVMWFYIGKIFGDNLKRRV